MTTAVVKNIISCLIFPFQINDRFLVVTLHEIFEHQKVKGSASKANKDFQILLFDVHVVHRTPKVSFPRRVSEQPARSTRRPFIFKSLIETLSNEEGDTDDDGKEQQ